MKTRFVVAAACTSLFAGALITYGAPKLLSGKPAYATPGVNFNTTVLGRGTVDAAPRIHLPIRLQEKIREHPQ